MQSQSSPALVPGRAGQCPGLVLDRLDRTRIDLDLVISNARPCVVTESHHRIA